VVNEVVAGAIGGCAGTLPMTAAMVVMHRLLPAPRRYPLPPRQITMRVARMAGLRRHMDEPERTGATLAAHFGYGTAAGALYGLVARPLPAPALAKGLLFGLALWGVSYLGLLPATSVLRSATDHPAERNALMIAAHLVWGATLGLVTDALADR
jgi:uncharacterized membrane protein YagU involved in acid resistance